MLGKIEIIGDWQKVICMWRLLISVKNIWDGSSKQLNINFFHLQNSVGGFKF